MSLPDLTGLRDAMEAQDAAREDIIKRSRTILKAAKQGIFLAHEDKLDEADARLADATSEKIALEEEYAKMKDPRGVGAYSQALEEYAEAHLFLAAKRAQALPLPEAIGVDAEEYLGALSDLCGELARTAIFAATRRDSQEVERLWQLVKNTQQSMAQFTLRGNLRKKYDAIKYHLQRIEQARYDLAVR